MTDIMNDKLHFLPAVGYKTTRMGLTDATDDFNNAWKGSKIACDDRTDGQAFIGHRLPYSELSTSELLTITKPMSPLRNLASIKDLPLNVATYVTKGEWDLGALPSPLEEICDARRNADRNR